GTTYRIAVDGYFFDTGNADLAWGAKADAAACPTAPPTISGTPRIGSTLTTGDGTWVDTAGPFTHQWYRCNFACTAIAGQTGTSYTVGAADIGYTLRADSFAGSIDSSSDPTGFARTSAVNGRIYWVRETTSPVGH